jgi:hypothetical protein
MNLSEPKSNQKATIRGTDPFNTRGMAVKGIDKSVASAPESSDAPPRWSQDSIVVSTFPKP